MWNQWNGVAQSSNARGIAMMATDEDRGVGVMDFELEALT
jgi:hypothetical protein